MAKGHRSQVKRERNAKKDTRFFLPFTGTTATIVYTGIGLILMSGAAFLIFVIFRKKDEEENKTN